MGSPLRLRLPPSSLALPTSCLLFLSLFAAPAAAYTCYSCSYSSATSGTCSSTSSGYSCSSNSYYCSSCDWNTCSGGTCYNCWYVSCNGSKWNAALAVGLIIGIGIPVLIIIGVLVWYCMRKRRSPTYTTTTYTTEMAGTTGGYYAAQPGYAGPSQYGGPPPSYPYVPVYGQYPGGPECAPPGTASAYPPVGGAPTPGYYPSQPGEPAMGVPAMGTPLGPPPPGYPATRT